MKENKLRCESYFFVTSFLLGACDLQLEACYSFSAFILLMIPVEENPSMKSRVLISPPFAFTMS